MGAEGMSGAGGPTAIGTVFAGTPAVALGAAEGPTASAAAAPMPSVVAPAARGAD